MRAGPLFRHACAAVIVLLALGAAASGGVLQADPNALSPWQGITNMQNSFFTLSVNADVEFAVYEPGQFALSFPGADPTGGSEYVYAYQIFNLAAGSSAVTALTVGLDGDEPLNMGATLGNIGFVASTGDVSPSAGYLTPSDGSAPPTSARWALSLVPCLPVGQSSDVLYFTSPAEPEWDSATITGSWPAMGQLPSPSDTIPVPEPTTLGVLALGSLIVLLRKRRARQQS